MKGEIFNLFEAFITENSDQSTFEDIYESAYPELETKDPFVGPGTYPDTDFFLIVSTAISKLNFPFASAVRAFGKYCFPRLISKVPDIAERCTHPRDLLMIVDEVIHVEVKKVYSGAKPPRLICTEVGENQLMITYQSRRKLYDFVEGMIEGLAIYYSTSISVERKIICLDDEEACEFLVTFEESS